jgi:glucose/arabinose dehydrogenase/plastocyanin
MKLKHHLVTVRFCLLAALFGTGELHAANVDVLIQNSAFSPAAVTINVGDTVTWRQLDFLEHTSTSGSGGTPNGIWDSPFLNRGESFTHTFTTAGTFPYFCRPHTFMTGTVTVQGAAASPPTVSITSPANNATFTAPANVEIQANATVRGSTITGVEFFNGGTSLGTDTTAPYSVNTTLNAGTHTLTARATAANGQSTTSAGITVTVTAPAATPVVNITAPANNATFTAPANVEIQANASVEGSTITGVEFFNGGTSLGTDTTAPYSANTTLNAGTHTLTARATAANGQNATSAAITVTVNAPAATPVVTITAPANNATLSTTNVTITANATVEGGTVDMVEFFDGATFLNMVHGQPFTITVNLAPGAHVLTAKATASNGSSSTSAPVSITIRLGGAAIDDPYPPMAKTDTTIELQTIADGMAAPLGLAAPNDGSSRLFVFDQVGLVYVISNGAKMETPLLDMRSRLVPLQEGYDERGLLGLATHPNFGQNGLIYTYSSEPTAGAATFPVDSSPETNNHQTVLAEWKIDAANTNRVDPATRREILRIDQPQFNHNGGMLHFGTDGMLYLALGDGGAADDQGPGHSPGGNGQNLNRILGKVIRIDVNTRTSGNGQYGIPSDNPFVGRDGLDEIYAYGFRNPYSWSFDRLTGELYVADVGQNEIEELDRVFLGGNYGWPIKEGTFYFDQNGDEDGIITATPAVANVPGDLIDPIAEYDHSEGLAIVGGYMYRGTAFPNLLGRYITGDFGQFDTPAGRLFVLDRSEFRELRLGTDNRTLGHWIKGFGQDQQGELYVFASTNLGPTGTSGRMFKIVPADYEVELLGIAREGTNVTVNWTNGVGPFVVESKSSLNDRAWRLVGAGATNRATLPMDLPVGVLRVTDTAGTRDGAFSAYLTGAAERPNPVVTTGTGTGTLVLEGNTLHFDIRYSGLSAPATLAHIHGPATAAEARGVLIDLAPFNGGAFGTSGTLSGSVTLSPEHKAHILAGKTYVNVHTTNNPGGEIRGQVAPMVWMADLSGAAERPNPVSTPGRGSGIFLLVGNKLTFDLDYANLKTNATLAHIHGPAGLNAPANVMVDLAPFNGGSFSSNGTMGGVVTLNADQLAALLDGLTYVNIHSGLHPGGEIRGQILPRSTAIPLTASLSGAAERPDPIDTPATGTGSFALEGNILHFNVRYQGLKAVANNAHIHGPAPASEPAGVLIGLVPFNGGAFGTNGTLSGSVVLSDAHRALILEGRTYVNIHSGAHGGGEIRGQILPSVMHTVLLGASERPASVHTSGRGRGSLLLAGDQLSMNLTYRGLSAAAAAAHIHGPASTSGFANVLVNLESLNGGAFGSAGSFAGTVSLNAAQLSALADALTYINVHTGTHTGGEIRGQVIR